MAAPRLVDRLAPEGGSPQGHVARLLREALLLLLKVGGLDEPRRARLALLPTQLGVVVGARRDPVVLSTLLRARGAALVVVVGGGAVSGVDELLVEV